MPASTVATLVFGLRDDSRTKMKLSNSKITIEQTLYAMIVDELRFISWTYSKEAHKGKTYDRKSVLKTLRGEYDIEKDDLMSFATPEEFEEYMSLKRG